MDFGLMVAPVSLTGYDYVHTHVGNIWGIIVRDTDPLALLDCVRARDLSGRALILPSRDEVGNEVLNWMGRFVKGTSIAGSFNLTMNAASLVRAGVGVLFSINFSANITGLRFVPLKPALTTDSTIVWKRGRAMMPAAQAFADFLRDASEA